MKIVSNQFGFNFNHVMFPSFAILPTYGDIACGVIFKLIYKIEFQFNVHLNNMNSRGPPPHTPCLSSVLSIFHCSQHHNFSVLYILQYRLYVHSYLYLCISMKWIWTHNAIIRNHFMCSWFLLLFRCSGAHNWFSIYFSYI